MAMRSRARNASGFSLTHRFIGATSLEGNNVGILSLLDRKLRNAIENDIKTECDPNAQRVLVVNSIVHDIELSWRCRRPRSRYDLPAGACGRVACQPGNVRCNERPVVIRGDTVGGYGKSRTGCEQEACVTPAYEAVIDQVILPWLESLAEARLWLTKSTNLRFLNLSKSIPRGGDSKAENGSVPSTLPPVGDMRVSSSHTTGAMLLETFWKKKVDGRPGWIYAAHDAEALRCEDLTKGVRFYGGVGLLPLHMGAIQRFWALPSREQYPFSHRSLLQTMLVLHLLPPLPETGETEHKPTSPIGLEAL